MGKIATIFENFMDISGLDLIPYAIGLSEFNSGPPFEPSKLGDIRENIQNLDSKKLDEALNYSKELLDEESVRGEKAESKAYNLMGVTGVSAAFITGISGLFPKETSSFSFLSVVLILTFYILAVVSLTLTALLASRAVMVRTYTRPSPTDILQMESKSLKESKLNRLATYIYCFSKNCQTHNIKVSYLMGAQLWFRNSILIFLILAFMLISSILNDTTSKTTSITGTPSPTTISQISPTASLSTATNRPTSIIKPTETSTSMPVTTSPTSDILTPITPLP